MSDAKTPTLSKEARSFIEASLLGGNSINDCRFTMINIIEIVGVVAQIEQSAIQAERERVIELVKNMKDIYGLSPKQKGMKSYPLEMNGYIEGYHKAMDDVLALKESTDE